MSVVFNRKRTAFDEEVTLERFHSCDTLKSLDKTRVTFRINIRIRDLDLRRTQQIALHIFLFEVWMVVANRERAEKPVEVDQARVARGIIYIRATAFLEIDDDLKTIEQNMLLDRSKNVGCGNRFLFLALFGDGFEVKPPP